MSFAENLQYLRAREDLTQEQLAERLDVSRQSVSKWESGASFPEMDTLLKLCDMFHVDLDTLLRGSAAHAFSQDTAGYDRFMTNYARKIAGAVSAILVGVALLCLANLMPTEHSQLPFLALFFLILTAAVVVFIASGIEEGNFRKQYPVIQDFYTEEEKQTFNRRFIWYMAGGVGAILFSIALLALFFTFFPQEEPYETLAGMLFLLIIAGAVFFLVYGGILEEKYKIAKYNFLNNPPPEYKERRRRAGSACAVIMILATALFLFQGLAYDRWNLAAVIYPVGGVLCGAVWVLLGPKMDE